MHLGHLIFLIVCMSCMRMGRMSKAELNLLHPDSEDTMAIRERVKHILHSKKPTFIEGRGPSISKTGQGYGKLHKKYNLGPKNPLAETPIFELNKGVDSYMLEGDMLLWEEQAKQLMESSKTKRMVTTNSDLYWDPAVPINYTIDKTLVGNDKAAVLKGIQFWMDNSCLKFTENPKGDHRLNFFKGDGCYSYVGKSKYSSQDISIGRGCTSLGTVTHEMSHALGFFHTQSSYDRDDYIFINYTNIQFNMQYNFAKFSAKVEKNLPPGMAYDMASVMQYNPYAFAIDPNSPTVVALNPLMGGLMGQRVAPVFSDVRMMNLLYNCSAHCNQAPSCQNFGYPDPNDCSRCKCPAAFGGPLCDEVTNGTAVDCNGKKLEATNNWQTFNGTAGDPNSRKILPTSLDCYWVIQGPDCSQIEIELMSIASLCYQQCPYQGMELNPGPIDLGGMLICCDSVVNETFTSSSNVITIRGLSRFNQITFGIRYRVKPDGHVKNCMPTTKATTASTSTEPTTVTTAESAQVPSSAPATETLQPCTVAPSNQAESEATTEAVTTTVEAVSTTPQEETTTT